MKKGLMLVVVLALLSMPSFSQVKFGLKAGLNIAKMKFDGDGIDVTPDSKIGPAIGAFVRFNLSDKFAIQPELLYSGKGTKLEMSEGADFFKETLKLDYLSIPIMAKYYVGSGFNLQLGPQFDVLLSAKDEQEYSFDGDTDSDSEDIKDDLKGMDFGLGFGLGFDLKMGLGIDARYVLGMSEIEKEPEEDVKIKNNGFQITLSYTF